MVKSIRNWSSLTEISTLSNCGSKGFYKTDHGHCGYYDSFLRWKMTFRLNHVGWTGFRRLHSKTRKYKWFTATVQYKQSTSYSHTTQTVHESYFVYRWFHRQSIAMIHFLSVIRKNISSSTRPVCLCHVYLHFFFFRYLLGLEVELPTVCWLSDLSHCPSKVSLPNQQCLGKMNMLSDKPCISKPVYQEVVCVHAGVWLTLSLFSVCVTLIVP